MRISWRWLGLAGVVAALGLLVLARPMASLILWLEPYLPGWGAGGVVLYGLVYAAAPLFMLPTLPFGLGAGILFGFVPGLVAVSIGSVLTASAGFLLSRYFLRHRIEHRIRQSRRFAVLDQKVARDGWKIVGLLRLTWLHCGFSNYACGLTAIPFRQYILASAAGQVPGNVIAVYLGTAGAVGYEILLGVERERTSLEDGLWGLGTVVALVVGLVVGLKAKRAIEHADRLAASTDSNRRSRVTSS
jgi:uncharacterized membrane protein YdjX (TVP38/TMEM64 family)